MVHSGIRCSHASCTGAVYAWSVFRIPLTRAYGWTISEVTIAFELAILVLGFAAFFGGMWMRRAGPRPVALLAALLYGLGTILAGQSHRLAGLYVSYGLIGGAGLRLYRTCGDSDPLVPR